MMLHKTKKVFEVPQDFDVEEFVRPNFGIYQGPRADSSGI